jgi:NTE family protein
METPEVLVLGGGGILGEAWMSAVLAGIEEAGGFDARDCGCFIGTSAGSIVAASLAAGLRPDARGTQAASPALDNAEPSQERIAALRQAFATAAGTAAGPLASLALASTAAGGAMLRRTVLRGVRPGRRSLAELGRRVELAGVRWDGRLRIAAVEVESGRRVVFGAPGAPELSPALAVQASCAIPGIFRPVEAGGRTYVDGGAWSPTNMDAADVSRGDRVLCLNPTASMRPTRAVPAGALGPVSRGIAAAEALALKNRGALVSTINPDQASAAAMGINLMDPRPRRAVVDAGLAQGHELVSRARRRAAA